MDAHLRYAMLWMHCDTILRGVVLRRGTRLFEPDSRAPSGHTKWPVARPNQACSSGHFVCPEGAVVLVLGPATVT